jgi:uncharacterized protein with GYD domain
MTHYVTHAAYKTDGGGNHVKGSRDRAKGIRPAMEALGGRLLSFYTSRGEHDVVIITEMPNNVSVADVSRAAAAGGAIKTVRTAPLTTGQEGMDAIRRASQTGDSPPF